MTISIPAMKGVYNSNRNKYNIVDISLHVYFSLHSKNVRVGRAYEGGSYSPLFFFGQRLYPELLELKKLIYTNIGPPPPPPFFFYWLELLNVKNTTKIGRERFHDFKKIGLGKTRYRSMKHWQLTVTKWL